MKILELCLSPGKGGLELYVPRCVEALMANDEVLVMLSAQTKIADRIEALGVHYLSFSTRLRNFPLLAARKLARFIDDEGVEVIHLHWGKDLPLAALAKYFSSSKPRLVYTRQMVITRPKHDAYHRFLYSQMDLMLTITEELAQQARDYLPQGTAQKVQALYYGVAAPKVFLTEEQRRQLRMRWHCTDEDFLVAIFARIEAFKGQHLVVEAIGALRAQGLPVNALIVGHSMNQEYPQELRQQVKELGLHEVVSFEDFVDDPQQWMQASDCVVLATIEETFGLVLVEAMRAGVAVIGSNRGGVPEIIQHGKNGLLFESGDSADLARQIKRYVDDCKQMSQLAEQGREDADKAYDLDRHFCALRQYLAAD